MDIDRVPTDTSTQPAPQPDAPHESSEAQPTSDELDFSIEFYDLHGYNQPELAIW